jgi:phosphate acyltransferase
MLPVAVDAMGGDYAPSEIIAGARLAYEAGIPVLLVGRSDAFGDDHGLPVLEASEVIEMDEDPAGGVRRKKDSSLVRCAEAVREGKASAMLSAGNTGATMASALFRMGRMKGVSRPAIATPIPVPGSTPTILLDAGANSEVQADWLVQFAKMGSVLAQKRFGIREPRVGLLSIGEEPAKGDSLRKEAFGLLQESVPFFLGNVEGRDVMTSDVDVVVTDGFTGNVVLKTLEGAVKTIASSLMQAISTPDLKHHVDALLPTLLDYYTVLSPDTYGGAMLLGVDGVCIISHGSSKSTAMLNAIKVAAEMVEADLVGALRSALSE